MKQSKALFNTLGIIWSVGIPALIIGGLVYGIVLLIRDI